MNKGYTHVAYSSTVARISIRKDDEYLQCIIRNEHKKNVHKNIIGVKHICFAN